MTIIALIGTKGGVGKSTLAVQLAAAQARSGRRVVLLDGDGQGSALASIALRAERPDLPQIAAGQVTDGRALRAQALHQRDIFEVVLIDAGGRDSSALRAALIVADVAVIPYAAREYDVWALGDVAALVAEAAAQRDGLRAAAVLNRADPGVLSRRADQADAAAREVEGIEVLDVIIRSRVAIADASAAGLAVAELPAGRRDSKAEREIGRFVCAIEALAGLRESDIVV